MKPLSYVTGIGLAVGAAYLLDPQRGLRRRKEIADRLGRARRRKVRALQAAVEDTRNRFRGAWFETRSRLHHGEVSDPVIDARVRSALGRKTSHPSAIKVFSENGAVELKGDVLADEVQDVLNCAKHVKGVHSVVNHLIVHESPEGFPTLQGNGHVRTNGNGTMRPSTALMVSLAGLGLAVYAVSRRGAVGTAVGALGIGLVAKGMHDIDGPGH